MLTEVQTARNSTTNYFNCRIQTGQVEAVRTVCYSPQKRTNLNHAFLNRSAVKIVGVKHTPSKRFHTQEEEFTIAKHAKISPAFLSFSFNESFSNQLCTITQALGKDLYESVDVKAKVLKKTENKQVIINDGEKAKYKSDCLIADETNSVKLVLWEGMIDNIPLQTLETWHF